MADKEVLGQQITLRVADSDIERIQAVCANLPFKRSAVTRAALRLGLSQLMADPTLLLQADARSLTETDFQGWKTLPGPSAPKPTPEA
ncbi:MAG: hypothetical protein KDD82_11215 [Planctomycetes bacterium]|nr:hypothetical protein [Planctomycetota bacterium]